MNFIFTKKICFIDHWSSHYNIQFLFLANRITQLIILPIARYFAKKNWTYQIHFDLYVCVVSAYACSIMHFVVAQFLCASLYGICVVTQTDDMRCLILQCRVSKFMCCLIIKVKCNSIKYSTNIITETNSYWISKNCLSSFEIKCWVSLIPLSS